MPVTPSEILSMQPRKTLCPYLVFATPLSYIHGFLRPLRNEIARDRNIGCNDKFIT